MPRLLISLAGVSVALLFSELALALYAPLPDPYDPYARFKTRAHEWIRAERPPHYRARTHAEPGLPGLTGSATFSVNNMGFRGDRLALPKPPRELRIFMVGGSTTECFNLDDAQAIHSVVQDVLGRRGPTTMDVKVYNAGRGGHRGVVWREDLMDRALESLNDGMRRVAREHAIPLFDLTTAVPKSIDMFFDDVHFNVRGAREAGTALARFLLEQGLVSRR